MFDHAGVAVRTSGKASRYVKMGRILLQGSLLSPLLFNLFIDNLPKILRSRNEGINIGGTKINSLIYIRRYRPDIETPGLAPKVSQGLRKA